MSKKNLLWLALLVIGTIACSTPKKAAQQTQEKVVKKTDNVKPKGRLLSVTEQVQLIPNDPNVIHRTLRNGLTYYIQENAKPADKVELRLVVNAGSILEDEDQLGLAHFMEHMNFNGTEHFKKNELVDYLQSIGVKFGAHLNAYTSFDQTVYILPIPSDDPEKLEKGLSIIEDWAFNALLEEDEINKERGVVLEELRTRLGAENRVMERYLPKIFPNSRYPKRLPIGKKEILENFTPDKIKRFYNDWYRPDLMAVVVVGDIDAKEMEEKIKAHFGQESARRNPRKREYYSFKNHKEPYIAIESDEEQTFNTIQISYFDEEPTILKSTDNTLKAARDETIEGLFTQMLNNRLAELKNGENPPFVYGYSYYGPTWVKYRNAFQSRAMATGAPKDAIKAILTESERVRRHGFQQGELDRAKMDVLAQMKTLYDNRKKMESKRLVNRFIDNFLENESFPSIEWQNDFLRKQLPSISLKDVNALINKYIKDANQTIVITGKEQTITEYDVKNLLASIKKDPSITPYQDKETRKSLMEKLPKKGAIVSEEQGDFGVTILSLSNGATVYLKQTDFKEDEILFQAVSQGGTSLISTPNYLKTSLALRSIPDGGVAGLDKNDLNRFLKGKVISLKSQVGEKTEGLNGKTNKKDLETFFQFIHLLFTDINKNEAAYKSYVTKRKGILSNVLSNPNYYFMDAFGRYQNEGDPRYMGIPKPEDYDKMDYELAYQLYKERFANAGDFNFYFVGNIDDNIKPLITQYIASLPTDKKMEAFKPNKFFPLHGDHTKTFYKGSEPKSAVNIIYQGQKGFDEKDALAISALGDILSIKLIEKLREKESGVYSPRVGAGMDLLNKDYSLRISFGCGPENVEKLKKISLEEVSYIAQNGPSEKDLNKAKEGFLLGHKEELKTNKFWLSKMAESQLLNKQLSEIKNFEKHVNDLTVKDIQRVAKKYFTQGAVIGILMPEKK